MHLSELLAPDADLAVGAIRSLRAKMLCIQALQRNRKMPKFPHGAIDESGRLLFSSSRSTRDSLAVNPTNVDSCFEHGE
eukprot:m.323261 g.323261  ORF g.323261 m.323261 type:complete len:79 (+) comp20358_c0_seq28:4109-4345(+)